MKTLLKKAIALSAIVLGTFVTANAQRFEVSHNGKVLNDGAVVEIKDYKVENEETHMKFEVAVTNTSKDALSMRMIKQVESLVANVENTICWDICMEPTDLESTGALSSGEVEHPYADLTLNKKGSKPVSGTSIIKYTFQSTTKGEASITVTVNYIYSAPVGPVEPPVDPIDPPVVTDKKFEVRHNNKLLEDGDVVEIKESVIENGEAHMKFKVDVTNVSKTNLSMRMIKDIRSVAANTENTMCWDVCVEPSEPAATCKTLLSGKASHPYADLILNKNGSKPVSSSSTIDYTFKTGTESDLTVTVTVKYIYEYKAPTGIDDVTSKDVFIVTQPAGEQRFNISTTLEGNTSTRLEIADFSGRIIQTLPIPTGSGNVTATDVLANGYYLLILKRENEVVGVRKGVIK